MFCTKCGKAVADGQKFCTHCGAPMGQAQASAPVRPAPAPTPGAQPVRQAPAASYAPPRKKTGGIVALVVTIVVLAIAAISLTLFFLLRDSGDESKSSGGDVSEPAFAIPEPGGAPAAGLPDLDLPDLSLPAGSDSLPADSFTVPGSGFDAAAAEGTYYCAQEPGSALELYDLGEQLSIYKTYMGKTDISTLIPMPTSPTFTINYGGRLVEFSWAPGSAASGERVVVSEDGNFSVFTPDGDRNWVIDATPNYLDPFEDPNGYILPTDSRYISEDELYAYDKEEVKLIRNEIYARYGYTFTMDKFQDYFRGKNWYHENKSINADTFGTQNMNEFERANVDTIRAYEKRMGW